MKKKYQAPKWGIKNVLLTILLLTVFSCEKLEVETPDHLITGETLFTDSNSIKAAVVQIYATLRDNTMLTGGSKGLSNLMGLYADELDLYSSAVTENQFYNNAVLSTDANLSGFWNGAYNQIYTANAILEGVENSSYLTNQEQDLFKGEALFIRGIIHFHLLNLFGDIPYITTTDYMVNKSVTRQTQEEVYALITKDLVKASQLLPKTDSSGERVRPNSYTAKALLARIFLYNQNWADAEQYATEVIENNGWETNVENVFLKTSSSTLWQFSPGAANGNTIENQTFMVTFAPPSNMALTNTFIDGFDSGDLRKEHWIGEISDGTNTWYFPYKYKIRPGNSASEEYSIVLRMAEQYLIRAEARARTGDISGAQTDINTVRHRAGLEDTTASTENELLDAILQERRVELFTEHGHRFFDLKRFNLLDAVLAPVKPGWDTDDQLLPIPENELIINPNL